MFGRTKIIQAALLVVVLLLPVGSASASQSNILPVEELEVGAEGYGLTVFEGEAPDTFAVEVLGVLENIMPGQDLILIRAESPIIERTQVLSGMSGSPIYIDNKLIGALGYSWAYQKEAIAGVTPAEDLFAARRSKNLATGEAGLSRVASPLIAGGFGQEVLPAVKEFFERRNVRVDFISGGGSAAAEMTPAAETEIGAGSAVGVQLVRGDLNLTSIGTVTEVDEGDVFAFGHPFIGEGNIEFPMTAASVQTLMPSLQSSFKIATARNLIGAVTEDRLGGVVGQLGRRAEMLPIRLRVENPAEQYHEEYHVEVVQNQYLSPELINLVAGNFALEKLSQVGVNLLETSLKLELKEAPDLELERLYSSRMSYDPMAFLPISRLWHNPFEVPEIEEVDVRMTLYPGEREARISELWTEPHNFGAGEKVTVYVKIDPYRGEEFVEEFKFTIPENIEGSLKFTAMPASRLVSELPTPRSLTQLVETLSRTRPQNELAVVLSYPGVELQMEGTKLEEVPGSLLAPLMEKRAGAPTVRSRSVNQVKQLDKLLLGSRSLQYKLRD